MKWKVVKKTKFSPPCHRNPQGLERALPFPITLYLRIRLKSQMANLIQPNPTYWRNHLFIADKYKNSTGILEIKHQGLSVNRFGS
jgi:hypothetical protein